MGRNISQLSGANDMYIIMYVHIYTVFYMILIILYYRMLCQFKYCK